MSLEDKIVWTWLLKADKQTCGGSGTKSSPTKWRFLRGCTRQEYYLLWGRVRLAWPCLGPAICTALLPLKCTPLPLPCVVVVHSCLRQALIRHEWGASLADMELHSKSSHVAWGQNCAGLAPQSRQTSLRRVRNKILPHKSQLVFIGISQTLPIGYLCITSF